MKIHLPETFNIEEFETQTKAVEIIKHYKRDKLAYLMHLINYIRSNDKRMQYRYTWVNLNSTILQQQGIANYNEYLKLLTDYGVVLCDNYYLAGGGKSKGYKFTSAYELGVKSYEITDFTLRQRLEKVYLKLLNGNKKYKNLKRWFNENLTINSDLLRLYINEECVMKNRFSGLLDTDLEGTKDPIIQFNCAQINLERFEKTECQNFTVDEFGYRFHSLLTNSRGILRKALKYNGKNLASIDISNSQPYFSTILFNKEFWIRGITNKRYKGIFKEILNNNKLTNLSIMLETIDEILAEPDVQEYIELVIKGTFYEYFEEKYIQETGMKHNNRGEIKSEMFLVLFSNNCYINQRGTEGKDLFKALFPNVYKLFKMIKRNNKRLLPQLLQRIESDIVLDDICEVLSGMGDIPVFSIHDSIATTEDNLPILREVMYSRLKDRMGAVPALKEEVWAESQIIDQFHELEQYEYYSYELLNN